ncbi:MAG: hypothetical protein ACR2PJ_02905 [Pseudomonadales bacterium]
MNETTNHPSSRTASNERSPQTIRREGQLAMNETSKPPTAKDDQQ